MKKRILVLLTVLCMLTAFVPCVNAFDMGRVGEFQTISAGGLIRQL